MWTLKQVSLRSQRFHSILLGNNSSVSTMSYVCMHNYYCVIIMPLLLCEVQFQFRYDVLDSLVSFPDPIRELGGVVWGGEARARARTRAAHDSHVHSMLQFQHCKSIGVVRLTMAMQAPDPFSSSSLSLPTQLWSGGPSPGTLYHFPGRGNHSSAAEGPITRTL